VIEATSGRIKARDHRVIRQPGEIISSRAVFKAVRHHEVKKFVSYRRPQTVSTASQARARTSSSVVKSVILFGHFIASGRGARVRCGRRILGIRAISRGDGYGSERDYRSCYRGARICLNLHVPDPARKVRSGRRRVCPNGYLRASRIASTRFSFPYGQRNPSWLTQQKRRLFLRKCRSCRKRNESDE
jgi:hypothetical protein